MSGETKVLNVVFGVLAGIILICSLGGLNGPFFDYPALIILGIISFTIGVALFCLARTAPTQSDTPARHLTIGAALFCSVWSRSVIKKLYWLYCAVAAIVLFFIVNRLITDSRLGLDSGGPQWASLKALGIFLVLTAGPIFIVRVWLAGILPTRDCWPLFLICGLMFAGLEEIGSRFLPSAAVCLGVPTMAICAWLAHHKFRTNVALAVAAGALVLIALVGTQLGFNTHPKKRMAYHSYDTGFVTISVEPWESRNSAIEQYRRGTKLGWSNAVSGGDEDYNYFLAINGIQLLLLTSLLGFGTLTILNSVKGRASVKKKIQSCKC